MPVEEKRPYRKNRAEYYGDILQRLLAEGYRRTDVVRIMSIYTGMYFPDNIIGDYIKRHNITGYAKYQSTAKIKPLVRAKMLQREGH